MTPPTDKPVRVPDPGPDHSSDTPSGEVPDTLPEHDTDESVELLLSIDRVGCGARLQSKKRALETLAGLLAAELDPEEVSEMDLLDALIARERLGTTGLGHGVSLPHGRIKGLKAPIGAMITLDNGVDYDAPDDQLVDILFALVVPENHDDDHLKILASLATLFSDEQTRAAIRKQSDATALYEVVTAELRSNQTDQQPNR